MKNHSKIWLIGYMILVIGALTIVGLRVVKVDPYFHYHKPNTDSYYYDINNQRSQNDGILKHFDYDALITGTSMIENFNTTEMDSIFGTNSIKVPYSGGTYKEIEDNLEVALFYNPDLKIVVRGLDMAYFLTEKDSMREDLGEYPTYLYDDLLYNDVEYIFNRDVIFKRVYPMVNANDEEGFWPGITSFDSYSNWMARVTFGMRTVCPNGLVAPEGVEPVHLSGVEHEIVLGTVWQNITSLAATNPDVTFYYFFPPYSIVWWRDLVSDGTIYKQIEAEQLVIEEVLKYDNIKLYSFNNRTDITTNLNNYKDWIHYGSWINSLMLRYMKDEKYLLTYDNYKQYLSDELSFYTTYDYAQLNNQVDYGNDYYAAALLNYEINGVVPCDLLEIYGDNIELQNANIVANQYEGELGLQCRGSLQRDGGSNVSISEYIASTGYVGGKIHIDDLSPYNYLVFYGLKNQEHGQPSVYIYGQDNVVLEELTLSYCDIDEQWHQYLIDVSNISGPVTIVFNGGYVDSTGSENSEYIFSNMYLY